jgi:hypothetical protein
MDPCLISVSTPIAGGSNGFGDTGNCSSAINVEVTGTSPSGHCMTLIINGAIIDEITFSTDGPYVLANPGIVDTDSVVIVVRDGNCLSTRQGIVSTTSSPSDACTIPLTIPPSIICWVTGNTDITSGLTVYTDPGMTIEVVGDGDFYHIQLDSYGSTHSILINSFGVTDGTGALICP